MVIDHGRGYRLLTFRFTPADITAEVRSLILSARPPSAAVCGGMLARPIGIEAGRSAHDGLGLLTQDKARGMKYSVLHCFVAQLNSGDQAALRGS